MVVAVVATVAAVHRQQLNLTHAVSPSVQEWRKTANRIDQDLVPILPLDRTVNVEILLDLLPKKTVSDHDIAGIWVAFCPSGLHSSQRSLLAGPAGPREAQAGL